MRPLDLIDEEGHSSSLERAHAGNRSWLFAVSAIRRAFAARCSSLCGELIDFRVFPDHHPYTARDVRSLERWVADSGANLVLTTQKDSVKLRAGSLGPAPLRAVRIGLEITAGHEIMDDLLASAASGTIPE